MDDSEQREKVPPSIRFIPDEPADADFFSTHTRLAEAIVTAIEANAEVKVVGLLGRWGSGKSTVARKVIAALEAREGGAFKVFPYDAWLHQSDCPSSEVLGQPGCGFSGGLASSGLEI